MKRLVNRTLAMHNLLTTKQGSRSWMEFIKELEDKAYLLDFDNKPYLHEDAVKDAAIFGMSDSRLKEKALTDDPQLKDLIRWGQARESGKEGLYNLKDGEKQVLKIKDIENLSDSDEIDGLIESLQVMKLRKAGKFSSRKQKTKSEYQKNSCNNCSSDHPPNRCPANGKECFTCGGRNHFSNSKACKPPKDIKYMEAECDDSSNDEEDSYAQTAMAGVSRISQWPGVQSSQTTNLRKISAIKRVQNHLNGNKHVNVKIGKTKVELFTDTGSEFTIIPPSMYNKDMGKVYPADTNLRAWGSKSNLDVKGMVNTTITTEKGASTKSKVFIVNGYRPEPLLGANDAQFLGFITFNSDGKDPSNEDSSTSCLKAISKEHNHNIPDKLRKDLNVKIETAPQTPAEISDAGRKEINQLIDKYKGLVFKENGIGKMKCDPIHLDYDPVHKPSLPPFHNVPLHYQKEVSDHLEFLRCQGVITDVDPKKSYDCVMNVVITDKKNGSIRMNIDNTPRNPGMKRTQYHIQTPQEIRHELKEAKFFTEMDMGHGYHQLEIDEETKDKAIFQTHEGVHRMERLYFGPTAASGIFHNEVRTALNGLKSTTNIHDNILVWGINEEDHLRNLADCLQRCDDKGISLKLGKSTFGMSSIKWFGRLFTTQVKSHC